MGYVVYLLPPTCQEKCFPADGGGVKVSTERAAGMSEYSMATVTLAVFTVVGYGVVLTLDLPFGPWRTGPSKCTNP